MEDMFIGTGRITGIAGSLLIHTAFIITGGTALYKPVQYTVGAGQSSIEISLVAAPAEKQESVAKPPEPKPEIVLKKEITEAPVKIAAISHGKTEDQSKSVLKAQALAKKGDGSAPISGRSATTVQSSKGAVIKAKPNYLSNPAPAYPYLAVQRGYEGEVVLIAAVNKKGFADKVEIFQSSGYGILDSAAIKAVQKWKFEPAKFSGVAVDSEIEIPVKFELATYQGTAG